MTAHSPIPDFAAARAAMIESQLRPQGVADPLVLAAMGAVLRERFLPAQTRPLAYVDRAVAIAPDRFLAAPTVLGQLLAAMEPVAGERALVIGAGMGYSAAVLGHMGVAVIAVESDPSLADAAAANGIEVNRGELEAGHAAAAPYDLVLIDGAVEFIPDAIVEQLADGGRLGTALVDRGVTRLIVGLKDSGAFGYRTIGDSGVPRLPGFIRPQGFKF
jgi:protein-L-isoaspartate(D-aspartate) O-methyltransferase